MRKFTVSAVATILCLVSALNILNAQTNPTAYDLNLGTYSLLQWPSTSVAGTYPPNMAFHMTANIDDPVDQVATADFNCAYNLTSGARINGRDASGFSFINTGTLVCNCAYTGSAVLALSTLNRAQINVTWTGTTVLAGTRPYAVRLQYRLATTGTWLNVMSAGKFVENVAPYNATGNTQTITSMLPTDCENKSLVQLRWVYHQQPQGGSGSRPQMQVDDITVTSNLATGTATNLAIENVTPAAPSQNVPFILRVRATDALGAAKNVTTATTVQIQVSTGTGTVSGTLTATIPAGSSFVDFTNVAYNVAEAGVVLRAVYTSGMVLTQGLSAPITFQAPSSYAAITGATQYGYVNVPMSAFKVTVYRADNTVDANYSSIVTVTRISGTGSVIGTASVAAINGVATFDNLMVNAAGAYQLQVNIPGLGTQTLPFTNAYATPTMNTDIVPQYITAATSSGTCNTPYTAYALPSYARVTFTGLTPNTTYRLNTGLATDVNLTSTGGGFNINYNLNDNTYFYSAGKSLTNAGEYSQFSTTSTETTKSIWVNLVTSTNVAFTEGKIIYWRVALGDNNGNLINRYQLASTSTVIKTGTASNQATGIVDDNSQMTEKNYVLLYDNTAGTGRPITTALVQAQGTTIGATTESWYGSRQNIPGTWATLIPNTFATGVRRIEERDWRTNAIVYAVTNATGVWNGVQTNPSDLVAYPAGPGGFTTPINLATPRITIQSPVTGDTLCSTTQATVRYLARGVNNVTIEFSSNNGTSWEVVGTSPASSTTATVVIPVLEYAAACRFRVTGVERTDISAVSQPFAVASQVSVASQPVSKNLCVGDNHDLVALTSGAVRAYQWFKDGVAIPGARGPMFRIVSAQFNTSGVYNCQIWGFGTCGGVTTENAHVRVARPTQIVNQTRNAPAALGGTAHLNVEAEFPNEAISYQWYKGTDMVVDNGRIQGSNSSRLTITNLQTSDVADDYSCVVVGVCGSATTKNIRVFTNGVYVEFPSSTVATCTGTKVTISGKAYANPASSDLEVRWWYKGSPLADGGRYSGAGTESLTIDPVTPEDIGQYTLHAQLTSAPSMHAMEMVNLVIASAPTITSQPQNIDVCEGASATLSVSASGAGTLRYSWSKDGMTIPGASGSTLTVPAATTAMSGNYTVTISTACGSVTSSAATVNVRPGTKITNEPPATLAVQVGQPLTISLSATGAGTIQYQWIKDGTPIAGEVAPTFAKAAYAIADEGSYWCTVTSECGVVTSSKTVVTTKPGVVSVSNGTEFDGNILGAVYPTPTFDGATFTLQLSAPSRVQINLVDATGAVVTSIANTNLASGVHSFGFNASNFATGMYRLVATVGSVSLAQPVAIVK